MKSIGKIFLITLVAGPIILFGAFLCLTLVGIVFGIPLIIFGSKLLANAFLEESEQEFAKEQEQLRETFNKKQKERYKEEPVPWVLDE